MELVLLESVTLAVIIFGGLAVFFVRRWFSPSREAIPAGLLLRFSVLLFGFCVIALIEGVLLQPYGFFWIVLVLGINVVLITKLASKLLGLGLR